LRETLAEAAYQRCCVHSLRNALDYVPRRVDDDCLQDLRWLYDRRDLAEACRDLAAWLAKWSGKYPKLTSWVEENIDEALPEGAASPESAMHPVVTGEPVGPLPTAALRR
jgi:putative transposase